MRWILWFACATAALAQSGTDPKRTPDEYDVHGQSGNLEIGAEFMIHSFSGHGQTYIAKDFLVVEVALFPPKDKDFLIDEGEFRLRLNGKKPLAPAPPSMVVSSLQHSEWQNPRGLQAGGGMGNAGVILGGPQRPTTPYPTPEPGPTNRLPQPRDNTAGIDREPPVKPEELVLQTALPEGAHHAAVSGFVYFPWTGKASSLKSVELLYRDTVLKLR